MFTLKSIADRHDLIMYACCLIAFIGVATQGVGLIFGVLFLMAFIASIVLFSTKRHTLIPIQFWNVVILLTVAGTAGMMFFSEESVITSGIRFILMLIAIKLLSRRGAERDDWQIYALTFLLMAAGTAVNEDILYGVVFALYVLFGTFGLALLHMRTEQDRTGLPPTSAMSKTYSRILIALGLTVFLSSVGIFFTFPRVGLGFFATKTRASMAMTGFSEQVELGSHGVIRNNPEVVMRVEFPDNKMPAEAVSYHWRMMSFDSYDGTQWARTRPFQRARLDTITRQPPLFDTRQLYAQPVRDYLEDAKTIRLKIYIEPLNAKQVPQLWPIKSFGLPQSIQLPFNPNSSWLHFDTMYHDLYINQRNELGVAYNLDVASKPSLSPLEQATYEPMEPERHQLFLQLPEDMERVTELASNLTQNETNPYKKAQIIERHLQTSYAYTTNLPPVEGNNPVNSFLFNTKQGHCEFFATAMTLMMRSQNIPARLVNGFLGGVWNGSGNYMSVRQGDAHSWVEVYLPEYGWVPFDPTPSSGTTPMANNSITQQMRDLYDTARMRWMQWVIEYNLDSQVNALRRFSAMLSSSSSSSSKTTQNKDDAKQDEQEKTQFPIRAFIIFTVLALLTLFGGLHGRRLRPDTSAKLKKVIAILLWPGLGALWISIMQGTSVASILIGATPPLLAVLVTTFAITPAHEASSRAHIQRLFTSFEDAIRKISGIQRDPSEGASQFFTKVANTYPSAKTTLEEISSIYINSRFSPEQPKQHDIKHLRTLIKDALTTIRQAQQTKR